MGSKTKIDWCDSSWNPVTGCYHDCPYCYARGMATRFGTPPKGKTHRNIYEVDEPIRKAAMSGTIGAINPYPHGFQPTLHRYKLDEVRKWKRPRTIFVCSMADLFGDWVPLTWIKEVFEACRKAPQHRYLFLTKAPERLYSLCALGQLPMDENFWFGCSVPTLETPYYYNNSLNTFVSIEPLRAPFHYLGAAPPEKLPKWIIIGAETGNRKGKVIPFSE